MRRLIPLSLFLLPLISSCGHAPQPPGVLRVAQEGDPSTLDPARSYDTTSITFTRLLYRGLVEYDFDAKIYDEVAQSHTLSTDGKTYRFVLRPNVNWWDGTPVEAEDFRYAIERAIDPETASDGSSFFTGIAGADAWIKSLGTPKPLPHVSGIEVPSPHELVFHLSQPDATFLSRLTLPFAYAVPRKYVENLRTTYGSGKELSDALSEHPMGCGPFKFVEWVHDSSLRLTKNPNYFRPGFPRSNALEAQFGISSTLQTMLFEQGAIDVLPITDAFPADFLRMKNSPKWKGLIADAPMMDIRYMAMNTEVAPFKDRRVRQAICYAINRDRIVSFLTGRASKARGAMPEGVQSYDPKLFSYPYDPAKAKLLLKEANFKSSETLPLLFSTAEPWYAKAAQSIQQDLAAVGIKVDTKGMRYGDLKAIAGRRGPTGGRLVIQGWIQDFPDPSNYLDPLFNGRSISSTASLNRSFYSNPKVNKLLDEALEMPNSPARWQKYQEAQRIIVDDAPVVFLHNTRRYIIRQPRIQGFRLHPAWSSTYEFLTAN
ncbi:putative D,D-dipeptide-binding periplasmic protein DdpA [Abditibacteriota bacterium]|nr:putative D,D-dipeptide-binding periplasmic protein DdpA [Abditibacteriota bacterium]